MTVTVYSCGKATANILESLKFDLENVLNWFDVNSLKPNPVIFQYMSLGQGITNNLSLYIGGTKIERSTEVILLGATEGWAVGNKLTFMTYIGKNDSKDLLTTWLCLYKKSILSYVLNMDAFRANSDI